MGGLGWRRIAGWLLIVLGAAVALIGLIAIAGSWNPGIPDPNASRAGGAMFVAVGALVLGAGLTIRTPGGRQEPDEPRSGFIERMGRRVREANAAVVGPAAATYAMRCIFWALLLNFVAVVWVAFYVIAIAAHAFAFATYSIWVLLLLGVPLSWLGLRDNHRSVKAAADYLEPGLGFRPRWWMCFSRPWAWNRAIARQRRWHEKGRWPLITW